MDLTIGDQYYLKAVSEYPYEMEAVAENLTYALSYDDEHAPANCLLGQVYMFHIKDFALAEACFNKALQSDLSYPDTYKYLALLKIWLSDMGGALKLIDYALKVKGMDMSTMLVTKALVYECRGKYKRAKRVLKEAKMISLQCDRMAVVERAQARVKKKYQYAKSVKKKKGVI